MNKIESQAWKHGTDLQWPKGSGEGDNAGKMEEGLAKEHIWMTHGYGQLLKLMRGMRVEWVEEGKIGITIIEKQ